MIGLAAIDVAESGIVVELVGYTLLAVLSGRLAWLSLRLRNRAARPQAALWGYFGFTGIVGLLAGGLGLVNIGTEGAVTVGGALLLAFALLLALAMREAYYNTKLTNTELDRIDQFWGRKTIELAFVAVVPVTALGQLFRPGAGFETLAGVTAVGVLFHGLYFHWRRTGAPATRGTLIDSLLRQTLPAMVFSGGAVAVSLLSWFSIGPGIIGALTNVFVLLTAASLMTVTIKLQQHLLNLP